MRDRRTVNSNSTPRASRLALVALLAFLTAVASACGDDSSVAVTGTADAAADVENDATVSGSDTEDTVATLDVQADTQQADAQGDADDAQDANKPLCPGGAGCKCASNEECDGGKCIDTPAGKQCAQTCSKAGDCAKGYSCKSTGGTDSASYCVPSHLSICAPCKSNKDCQVQGLDDALCLDYGAEGKFCGGACTDDPSCPEGYQCLDTKDAGTGNTVKQCRKKPTTNGGSGKDCSIDPTVCEKGEICNGGKCGIAVPGVCECSDYAKKMGTVTTCGVNENCSAERKCGEAGLEVCKAKTPKDETCNLQDDNCDGVKDNLPATFECFKKGFIDDGSKSACTTDADCTVAGEACDEVNKVCKKLIGKCKGIPTCGNVEGQVICLEAKTPTLEVCDGEDNNCDGVVDEGYEWTNPVDGSKAKYGQKCGVGPCENGIVQCAADKLSALCTTEKNSKPETCDAVDNDCNGKVDDAACEDNNACTADACDGATKVCTNQAKDCGDGKQCTEDKCDTKTGDCSNPDLVGACTDGDPCTVGDACGDVAGKWECIAGKDAEKCDDNNPCTNDSCEVGKGCKYDPNAATVPCYSGAPGTDKIGVCKGGTYQCKAGQIDKSVCLGEVVPAAKEACDGKDDTCDGKVDEGCKPTAVAVTFSSAYVSGKAGADKNLQMIVGPSGPVGAATGKGQYNVQFGFLAWLMQLVGVK